MSLHCIVLHSEPVPAGGPASSASLNCFLGPKSWRYGIAHTHFKCVHCSSIVVRRLGSCGVAFLPRLGAQFFMQQIPQTSTRLVQMRLRVSILDTSDLLLLFFIVTLS